MNVSMMHVWMILIGVLCNVACALPGCFLVLRRMSLLGDAISHAVLPGIVIGFLLSQTLDSWMLFAGAMVFGVLTAFLTETLRRYGGIAEDASLGIVFTALFALGVLLINAVGKYYRVDLDADCVLHGNLEWVVLDRVELGSLRVPRALFSLVPIVLIVIGFVVLLWKELKISAFDPALSTAVGLNSSVMHYLLMGLVAVVTVAAFQVVGSVLVVAMLIVPAATAHLLTDRLSWMLLLSAAVATVAAVLGYGGARLWDLNTAGMMAVAVGVLFTGAVMLAPRHGLLAKGLQQCQLSLRISSEDVLALLYRTEERGGSDGLSVTECGRAAGTTWTARWAVPSLLRQQLVERTPSAAIRLTSKGRDVARSLVRSHRLWEAYLVQHFDLPLDHLHEPAERVEHFIGPALQEKLSAELSHPASDPHGRPIPGDEKS